ncbi:hypothetical protein CR513_04646, partial [Mucuna pruriens]
MHVETVSDKAQSSPYRTIYLMHVETTKNELIKLTPLPGTQSSCDPLYDLDPEIELTLRRLRKARNIVVSNSSNSVSSSDNSSLVTNTYDSVEYISTNNFTEKTENNNKRTLKELATPDVAFPFSLDGAAKDWLYLHLVLFNTWGDMKRMFLEKFFLASRTTTTGKEICGIRQYSGETLLEYWERFNKLCATCSHHQISEQLLI